MILSTRSAACALALTLALGCAPASEPEPEPASLNGVWQTEGYGHVIEVGEASAQFYELTAVSCLPSFEVGLLESDREGVDAVFDLSEVGLEIEIQPGAGEAERWMAIEGLASRRRMARVEALPEICNQPPSSDPQAVYDVFWHTYREHYPFFAIKGVDWQQVRDQTRGSVSDETTGEQLFEVLSGMFQPLEDAHTFLSAPDLERVARGRRSAGNLLEDEDRERARKIIESRYLTEPPTIACNQQVITGPLPNQIRYLSLSSFNNFGSTFKEGMACLDQQLDALLADADRIAGLVLDVRINSGGSDIYGIAIASRLTSQSYLAYTKEARNDPSDPTSWSEGQPKRVLPTDGARFTGPVVILTGPRSVSAAETFTMALMGRTPAVERIGEHTQGVFSDVMTRALPNGWSFGLPNERFLTEDGRSFDGPGIPPTLEVPVFAPEDLSADVDPALERAIAVLSR